MIVNNYLKRKDTIPNYANLYIWSVKNITINKYTVVICFGL